MHSRCLATLLAAVSCLFAAGGCAQLTPSSVDAFGAEKTVIVTLRDGETLKGHIDVGEEVTFTSIGRVYRARVESLSDNGDIVLSGPFVLEEFEHFSLQRDRMESSTLHIRDEVQRIEIPAYKIVKVEEVSLDRMKSARAAGFLGFTLFVATQILSARL